MKIASTLVLMSTITLGLYGCGDNDRQEQEQAEKKGVFTPYVEAHKEATHTADAVNEAMQRREERLHERD